MASHMFGFSRDSIPVLSVVDSPIEGKFVQALFDYMKNIGMRPSFHAHAHAKGVVVFDGNRGLSRWSVVCGYRHPGLGKKSVDFLVSLESGNDVSELAVELDGRMSHSTDEQKARDREKDRIMLSLGVPVVRFSGTEVNSDAGSCVCYVIDTIESISQREFVMRTSAFYAGAEYALMLAKRKNSDIDGVVREFGSRRLELFIDYTMSGKFA